MDTWATSSLTPQIVGIGFSGRASFWTCLSFFTPPAGARDHPHLGFLHYREVPFPLRQHPPWEQVLISGWGIAGEGMGKISKSRGGGPLPPLEMIERYSADAVRYWAASTGPGKDAVISEEKIKLGARLVNKLWNMARFSARFPWRTIHQGWMRN